MPRIVTGPFHPALELALIEEVRSLKAGDPFASLAIVVPSTPLASRLKGLLAIESQLPLLNCSIMTFHQFALRLRDDLLAAGEPLPRMQLVDDFYFEQLVRHVVERKLPGLEMMGSLLPSPGTWTALWSTLRDLKDAAVVPSTAINAVTEGLFEKEDCPWLQALFMLEAAVLEGSRALAVASADDLLSALSEALPRSPFFMGFKRICYYGFYDFLQIQLSFLEAVTRHAQVTLYVPLETTAPYAFARRFFDRHLMPLAESHEIRDQHHPISFHHIPLSVTNVIGSEEELAAVCREILTLVEAHGYHFEEIGVVARTLEPYRSRLQSAFDRHLVPFTSTTGQPLSREPLVKAVLRLASLPLNDFERSALLDVVTSPFYRIRQGNQPAVTPRQDQWRIAVATLGITRGQAEWQRLSAASASSILQQTMDQIDAEPFDQPIGPIDPAQAALLAMIVARLMHDCEALPTHGSVNRLTDAFLRLIEEHFAIPGWDDGGDDALEQRRAMLVGTLIKQALTRLSALDPLYSELSWEAWMELFRRSVDETVLPLEGEDHQGVSVLDAMEARGLRFRALFVIGLNEQVFPRFIREDAFLRDRQRQVMASTLGFLIEEKLAGHEEERLLFELLCRAATHRLYLSYQRADQDGLVMAPSVFIDRALVDPLLIAAPETLLARRLTARMVAQPTIQELLPVQDLALTLLLRDHDAGAVLDHSDQDRLLCEHSLTHQKIRECDSLDFGPFDGLLGPEAVVRSLFDQQGVSPTSLERYASCPFRYFSEKVLRLHPVRMIQDRALLPLTVGTLIHDTLRLTYERLTTSGWPDVEFAASHTRHTVSTAAAEVFSAHATTQGTGHELLWSMTQDQIIDLVSQTVASDEEEYRASGFRPHSFETEAEGSVFLGAAKLKIRGKLDRIDVRSSPPAVRIVDYKFKQGVEMGQQDRNLLLSAVRGLKLQPPLYGSMTIPSLATPSEVQFLYLAPQWDPPIARSTFEVSAMTGKAGRAITDTIGTLVQGIERREFFILPDSYCDHCEFSAACRRNDQTAWWRSYRSPQARTLRRLRKQKVQDD
jgi:ATP-dependent helicase/nuclease subunit B